MNDRHVFRMGSIRVRGLEAEGAGSGDSVCVRPMPLYVLWKLDKSRRWISVELSLICEAVVHL